MRQHCIPLLAVTAFTITALLSSSPLAAADDLCATAKAAVTVDKAGAQGDTINAHGTWQVSGGAAGTLVEVRIDADRWQSESFQGTQGTWEFNEHMKWNKCGHYSLRIWAYPSVPMKGHLLNCLDHDTSAPWVFDIPCGAIPEISFCNWECGDDDETQCVGTCNGTAKGGISPYKPLWGINDRDYRESAQGGEASLGPWSEVVRCTIGDKVSFKVRERNGNGKESPPAEIPCGGKTGGKPGGQPGNP